jgi:Family of unknown function (DUF6404)
MSHRQKVDHLIEELGKQGVDSDTAAPPLFRLFWKLGLHLPPPFFLSFGNLALVMGTCFGVLEIPLWVILICLSLSPGETVVVAVLTGAAYGLVMAWYLRSKAARLWLPSSWKDYPEAQRDPIEL